MNDDMVAVLLDFPNQCRIAQEIGEQFSPRRGCKGVQHILWCGMGGSAIGGDIVGAYAKQSLAVPFTVNRHYRMPAFVNRHSFVVISSYSGDTEEAVSCYQQARRKKASILVICSGGTLLDQAIRDRTMLIVIPHGLQPRCAVGYLSIPVIVALMKLGLLSLRSRELTETVDVLEALREKLKPTVGKQRNTAKQLAAAIRGRVAFIYGSCDLLATVAYRWRAQIAENAKMFASHHVFAEMNHNEVEAFGRRSTLPKKAVALFLKDRGDHIQIKKRMTITKNIMRKRGVPVIEVESVGRGMLARMFSTVYIGDWVSYYLAGLNRVDPVPVDCIQYLKRRLRETTTYRTKHPEKF